jgi:hypothetical protein
MNFICRAFINQDFYQIIFKLKGSRVILLTTREPLSYINNNLLT